MTSLVFELIQLISDEEDQAQMGDRKKNDMDERSADDW